MDIRLPYLLFLADATDPIDAKTAFGVRDWRPEACVGQWRMPGGTVDLALPSMDPAMAASHGASSLLIGIAPFGGRIAENWIAPLCEALEAGLDLVSGLHARLADIPAIATTARRCGRTLHDIRHPREPFQVATGLKRSGKRILTVGTDCALGKKYAALALTRAFHAKGLAATFRATGQTGILISGSGVAVDAVIADFVAGAAEWLSPANDADHWDIIEGQGSLVHPAYAGVSLGLLHGSQPDILILCHMPGRLTVDGFPGFAIPPLPEVMAMHLLHARRTNPAVRFAGVALNTSAFPVEERPRLLEAATRETGLPAFDPMRSDLSALVEQIITPC